MVGPFMQGMLLLGIIYFYSKGMMSLINDYYRGEFQRKLQTETAKSAEKPSLNMDNFMDYVRELDSSYSETTVDPEFVAPNLTVCCARSFLQLTGAWSTMGICQIPKCYGSKALLEIRDNK